MPLEAKRVSRPRPQLLRTTSDKKGLWVVIYTHRYGEDTYCYVGGCPTLNQVVRDIDTLSGSRWEGERPKGVYKPKGWIPDDVREDERLTWCGPYDLPINLMPTLQCMETGRNKRRKAKQ